MSSQTSMRGLISQTAVYGVSAILSKFLNYLLTPYLTRIMTTEVYGEVSLLYGIIPFANVLLTMGFATTYFRWIGKMETPLQQKSLFTTMWGTVSLFAMLFMLIVFVFRVDITGAMGYTVVWHTVVTAILIFIDNVNAMLFAALRQAGKALKYTIVNVTSVIVNIVMCVVIYTFKLDAVESAGWVVVANILASLSSTILMIPTLFKMLTKKIDFSILVPLFKYSLPLMIAGVMGVSSEFLDRQMIRWLLPDDIATASVGIYGAVSKIAALMIIFRQVYTLGAEPFFLQKFKNDDFKIINAKALKFFTIVGIAAVLFISFFDDLFVYIIGANFREGIVIVPILLVTNLLMGILVNLSFWYKVVDKTRYAIFVTLLGLIAVTGLSFWLVPTYGYVGAAYAHLAGAVVMVVASYIFNQINFPVPYEIGRLTIYAVIGTCFYFGGNAVQTHFGEAVGYTAKILLLLLFMTIAINLEKINIKTLLCKK